jgi:hypothetical protein
MRKKKNGLNIFIFLELGQMILDLDIFAWMRVMPV